MKLLENNKYVFGSLFILVAMFVILFNVLSFKQPPKFKSGECVDYKELESWETVLPKKILELGKKNYRYIVWNTSDKKWLSTQDSRLPFVSESLFKKVECPVESIEPVKKLSVIKKKPKVKSIISLLEVLKQNKATSLMETYKQSKESFIVLEKDLERTKIPYPPSRVDDYKLKEIILPQAKTIPIHIKFFSKSNEEEILEEPITE